MNAQALRLLSVGALLVSILSCSQPTPQQQAATSRQSFTPPAYSYKIEDDDGQWQMPAKNYASTRFSNLSEINPGNAKNLKVAWTFSTGDGRRRVERRREDLRR